MESISRRQFLKLGTAVSVSALLAAAFGDSRVLGWSPGIPSPSPPSPVVKRHGRVASAEMPFSARDLSAYPTAGLSLQDDTLVPDGTAPAAVLLPSVESPVPFLAFGCLSSCDEASRLLLFARTSADGQTWDEWQVLEREDLGRDVPDGAQASRLLFSPDGSIRRYVQFAAQLDAGDDRVASPKLRQIRLIFIDPGETPKSSLTGAAASSSLTIQGIAKPSVVSRTGWGCPDGQSSPNWLPEYKSVSHIAIHHSAGSNTSSDWPGQVRAIWTYHSTSLGWGDAGYHYLVDPNGAIYEGRAGGDDVEAGHVYGFNKGTMGVCCLGTYSTVDISNKTLDSVLALCGWKCDQKGFASSGSADIQGTVYGTLTTVNLPRIVGHRDFPGIGGNTECPGDKLEATLPVIRAGAVADTSLPSAWINPMARYERNPFWVTWGGSDNRGVTCYDVQYKVGATGTWAVIPNQERTTNTSVQCPGNDGVTYYFRCRAYDAAGNVSAWSAEAVTTIDLSAPATSFYTATHTDAHSWFVVTWGANDTVSGVRGYDLEWSSNWGGTWNRYVSDFASNSIIFRGSPGVTYQFRVRAKDGAGNVGGWASVVTITAGQDGGGLKKVFLPIAGR